MKGGKAVLTEGLLWAAALTVSWARESDSVEPPGRSVAVWTVPASRKVFRDERPAADGQPPVALLESAAGETEAVQVVIRPWGSACTLAAAEVSPFRDARGAVLSDVRVEILQVGYVYLPEHDRAWPDPLPPLQVPLGLQPGLAQPLWLGVTVPPTAPPGTFDATLRLAFEGLPDRDVPVRLRVFGFRLPARPSMRTAIGNQSDFVLRQHDVVAGSPQATELVHNYYRFFVDRRMSPYELPCDLAAPEAARWVADPRVTSFVVPYAEDESALRRSIERVRDLGALDKGFFYVWDEPRTPDDFDELARRARRIRALEPRAAIMAPFNGNPRQESGRSTYERLDGLVDQWCPLSSAVEVDEQAARAARGEGSWWYVCCAPDQPRANLMVDWPGAAHRVLFWQQKQRGIGGFLYWSATYWDPKFTRDPWSNIRTFSFKGDCYGDGSLVYPGDRVGIPGPVSSIRLELLRDGIDDFDYLTLFERLRGREATLRATRRVTTSLDDYSVDPAVLDGVRRELAIGIEAGGADAGDGRGPAPDGPGPGAGRRIQDRASRE